MTVTFLYNASRRVMQVSSLTLPRQGVARMEHFLRKPQVAADALPKRGSDQTGQTGLETWLRYCALVVQPHSVSAA